MAYETFASRLIKVSLVETKSMRCQDGDDQRVGEEVNTRTAVQKTEHAEKRIHPPKTLGGRSWSN